MSEVNKLKSVSYKGKRGFLLQVPIYGKDKKTIVAMPRFSMIWNSTMLLKSVWFSCLIFLEVGMTVLVIAATVVVLTSILRPMRQLHETMGVITDSPSDLELRSKIESHDEIGDLAVNFNRMMDKIQENNQMQMRFLSDVSMNCVRRLRLSRGIWTSCNVGVKMTLRFLKKVLRLQVTRPTV